MKASTVILPDGVPVPRVRHAPYVKANAWEDITELAASYGLTLLAWQENAFKAVMGERRDGTWAARHIGLSVPRQNGKGSLLEARALSGLLVFGERMIIHSAHEVRTAQIGFQRLKSYFENYDDLRRKVASIGNAVAREYIRLRNGQEVRFVSRSKSAIRGFSADCLLLDEAQILGDLQWEAILYTVSARPKHQIWLVGTPPLSLEEGVVFNRFRERGSEGADKRMAWLEWSAESDADLDDPQAWAQANPALGSLSVPITHEVVRIEREAASYEGFARERLGIWAPNLARQVFDVAQWTSLQDTTIPPPTRVAMAVDVAPDRSWSCIGVAGDAGDGNTLVMVFSRPGTSWITAKVAELSASHDVDSISLVTNGQAALLQADFTDACIEFFKVGAGEVSASCAHFQAAITNGTIRHLGQRELDNAVASARVRVVGERQVWDRRDNQLVDISPVVSVAAAAWQWSMAQAPMPAIY